MSDHPETGFTITYELLLCVPGELNPLLQKKPPHTPNHLSRPLISQMYLCVSGCDCVCVWGGITIQNILVKALCRQDRKIQDTMHHIFKVHFVFCLLASRAPWFECSVSRFSSYTCKERYHKPLASCLGWEDSKEKKKKKGKEKKRKEKKKKIINMIR